MLCHHIGDILEHFQRKQIQIGAHLILFPHRLLQCAQILIDIPPELQPVDSGEWRQRCGMPPPARQSLSSLSCSCRFLPAFIPSFRRNRRHIHRRIPALIDRRIRGIPRLRLHHAAGQRSLLYRKRLRLHLPALLIGLPLNARPRSGAVIQHMPDMPLVAVKLKQQRKGRQLHLRILDQRALIVQLLPQRIVRKASGIMASSRSPSYPMLLLIT